MITQINLTNFQSHVKSVLKLSPGINVICGASDSGKSAIIRGLRWVIENRPSGDGFCSTLSDGGDTVVSIHTAEGTVSRIKGKKTNCYQVDGDEFKAMGTAVPEEATAILNMKPVNCQYQMDSPFLLSAGSGEVSQYMNQVAKLDVIDVATSNIRKQVLNNGGQQRNVADQLVEIEASLEKYQNLDELDGRVAAAEGLEGMVANKEVQAKRLFLFISTIREEEKQQAIRNSLLKDAMPVAVRLQEIHQALDQKEEEADHLFDVIESVRESQKRIDAAKSQAGAADKMQAIQALRLKLNTAVSEQGALSAVVRDVKAFQRRLIGLRQEEERASEEYREAVPETCPTCGKPWDV
jgi:exonuclease SbcC